MEYDRGNREDECLKTGGVLVLEGLRRATPTEDIDGDSSSHAYTKKNRSCRNCGSLGHYVKTCPTPLTISDASIKNNTSPISFRSDYASLDPQSPLFFLANLASNEVERAIPEARNRKRTLEFVIPTPTELGSDSPDEGAYEMGKLDRSALPLNQEGTQCSDEKREKKVITPTSRTVQDSTDGFLDVDMVRGPSSDASSYMLPVFAPQSKQSSNFKSTYCKPPTPDIKALLSPQPVSPITQPFGKGGLFKAPVNNTVTVMGTGTTTTPPSFHGVLSPSGPGGLKRACRACGDLGHYVKTCPIKRSPSDLPSSPSSMLHHHASEVNNNGTPVQKGLPAVTAEYGSFDEARAGTPQHRGNVTGDQLGDQQRRCGICNSFGHYKKTCKLAVAQPSEENSARSRKEQDDSLPGPR